MGEIECLACGKAIKPRQLNDTENYDTENYDGQIVCQECKSLLYVKLVKGKVQKHKIIEDKSNQAEASGLTELLMKLRGHNPQQIEGCKDANDKDLGKLAEGQTNNMEKEERESNTQ